MTNWIPDLEGRDGPTYRAIADAIGDAIADGTLPAGQKLPTHRDLAWRLGITVTTVTRAYQEARRRGLVEGEVGRGTFVRATDDSGELGAVRRFHLPPGDDDGDSGAVNLSLNFPPFLGQAEAFAETLADMARSNTLVPLLGYQHSLGLPEHRAAGARWIGRVGLPASAEGVVVTCGGQHAMDVAFSVLCRPGDVVLTEPMTYPGMKALAGRLDLRLVSVPGDEDGMRPDALEECIRIHQPRALYILPTLQNPTARTMPEARRRAVAAVVERHDLFVVEDDVYGMLPPDRPPPLSVFLPQRSVYLTNASKSMAPGLRIGWVLAPDNLMPRFQVAMRASCWMAPPPMAEVARRWIEDGTAATLVARMRADVRERRALADDILGLDTLGLRHNSDPYSYHLWLPLPEHWHAEAFVDQVQRMGAIILPAETFAVGKQRPRPGVRICIGTTPRKDRVLEGLRIVARALAAGPDHLAAVL